MIAKSRSKNGISPSATQFSLHSKLFQNNLTGNIMGRAVQIVKIDDESETHKFFLDEEALNDILNKDNIRDKPICIISVAGKDRFVYPFLFLINISVNVVNKCN